MKITANQGHNTTDVVKWRGLVERYVVNCYLVDSGCDVVPPHML